MSETPSATLTETQILFGFCESSLHAGTGSLLSHIDLPIQREVHTGHPIVYGSGVKGALRDHCRATNGDGEAETAKLNAFFGPEKTEHAGLAVISEARLALFPVRSFRGVFAWLTCPRVLAFLQERLTMAGLPVPEELKWASQDLPEEHEIVVPSESPLEIQRTQPPGDTKALSRVVVLEELDFEVRTAQYKKAGELAAWYSGLVPAGWQRDRLKTCLALVSDEVFTYYVRYHTEVQTHVKLKLEEKTVEFGPWNEEALPPETLLAVTVTIPPMLAEQVRTAFADQKPSEWFAAKVHGKVVQMSGNRTLGQGLVRFVPYSAQPKAETGGMK